MDATITLKELAAGAVRQRLAGDASGREFFRLSMKGNSPETAVLMDTHHPFSAETDDWLVLRSFLERCAVPVPALYYLEPEQGLVCMEDCGDLLMENAVKNATPEGKRRVYRAALDLLAFMQARCTKEMGPENPAAKRRFDAEKYLLELDFTLEHFINGLNGKNVAGADADELRRFFSALVAPILDEPLHFSHRDYHSRNLILRGETLCVLDFQDARLGPLQYDLASLLYDSYVNIGDGPREELLDYYCGRLEAHAGIAVDRPAMGRVLRRVALQRNLKALGTFGFQATRRGKGLYLAFVPDTVGYVAQNLPLFKDLEKDVDRVLSLLTR